MKEYISRLQLVFGTFLYNLGYKLIQRSIVLTNEKINPKHRILNYHKFFVDNVLEDDVVLDIGSGMGQLTYLLSKKAKNVVGVEINKRHYKAANTNYKNDNLEFILGDATKLNMKNKFDVAALSNVLEHIDNRSEFLNSIKALSQKLIVRVPLITRHWLAPYLKEKGMEYRLDASHFIEYTEESIKEELENAGFSIKSFYVKWGEWYGICFRRDS